MQFSKFKRIILNSQDNIEIENSIAEFINFNQLFSSDEVNIILGIGYQKLKKYNDAILYFKKINNSLNFDEEKNYNIALCHLALENYHIAIEYININLQKKKHDISNEFQS